jgi:hypothetical protein
MILLYLTDDVEKFQADHNPEDLYLDPRDLMLNLVKGRVDPREKKQTKLRNMKRNPLVHNGRILTKDSKLLSSVADPFVSVSHKYGS